MSRLTDTDIWFKTFWTRKDLRASYLPPSYDPQGDPYPLLLLFDNLSYTSQVPTPRILDKLDKLAR